MNAFKWMIYLLLYLFHITIFVVASILLFVVALIASICCIGSLIGILFVIIIWALWFQILKAYINEIIKWMKSAKTFLDI